MDVVLYDMVTTLEDRLLVDAWVAGGDSRGRKDSISTLDELDVFIYLLFYISVFKTQPR